MKNKINKISKKHSIIGVIGLGYVGLPLALCFVEEKFKVLGFDIDQKKVQKLNKGQTYIHHINVEKISNAIKNGFRATSNFNKISELDVILICVPTPLGVHNEPDLSYIINTLDVIKPQLKEDQLLILEMVGTFPNEFI